MQMASNLDLEEKNDQKKLVFKEYDELRYQKLYPAHQDGVKPVFPLIIKTPALYPQYVYHHTPSFVAVYNHQPISRVHLRLFHRKTPRATGFWHPRELNSDHWPALQMVAGFISSLLEHLQTQIPYLSFQCGVQATQTARSSMAIHIISTDFTYATTSSDYIAYQYPSFIPFSNLLQRVINGVILPLPEWKYLEFKEKMPARCNRCGQILSADEESMQTHWGTCNKSLPETCTIVVPQTPEGWPEASASWDCEEQAIWPDTKTHVANAKETVGHVSSDSDALAKDGKNGWEESHSLKDTQKPIGTVSLKRELSDYEFPCKRACVSPAKHEDDEASDHPAEVPVAEKKTQADPTPSQLSEASDGMPDSFDDILGPPSPERV